MTVTAVELFHAVTYTRDEEDGLKPLPGGYSLDRLTVMRADKVRAGDLVVGSVDQPLNAWSRLRWATYLSAAYVAQPAPFEADCPSCKAWTAGADGPWVTLYPHCPERTDALISVIPADSPVDPAPRPCVHTCTCKDGFLRQETRSFSPPSVCGDCHRRPCTACAEAGGPAH